MAKKKHPKKPKTAFAVNSNSGYIPPIQPGESGADYLKRIGGQLTISGGQGQVLYNSPEDAAAHGVSKPLPVDPGYDATVAGLGQRRDNTLGDLTYDRSQLLSDSGYTATYDDAGNVTGLSFDPNNPFSRAALLRRTYQQNKLGTTNSMAARGQLYSGALTNAQNTNDFNYQQSDDALQKGTLKGLTGISRGIRDTKSNYDIGVGQAGADRLGRATSNPLYSPAPIGRTINVGAPAQPRPHVTGIARQPTTGRKRRGRVSRVLGR